jgi:hypothetical protein
MECYVTQTIHHGHIIFKMLFGITNKPEWLSIFHGSIQPWINACCIWCMMPSINESMPCWILIILYLFRNVANSLRSKGKLTITFRKSRTVYNCGNSRLATTLSHTDASGTSMCHDIATDRFGGVFCKRHAIGVGNHLHFHHNSRNLSDIEQQNMQTYYIHNCSYWGHNHSPDLSQRQQYQTLLQDESVDEEIEQVAFVSLRVLLFPENQFEKGQWHYPLPWERNGPDSWLQRQSWEVPSDALNFELWHMLHFQVQSSDPIQSVLQCLAVSWDEMILRCQYK